MTIGIAIAVPEGAILTAGMASIGSRTSRAVFKKLEQQCPEFAHSIELCA